MRTHSAFFLIFCALVQTALASSTRIVGGITAVAGEYPFIVSLQRPSHFCGGSLVDKKWVLTAAHCVKGSTTSGLKLRVGLYKQGEFAGVETFSAKKIVIHPEYNSSTNDYDFALIQLDGESQIPPIPLIERLPRIPDEEDEAPLATTAGWGATSEGGGTLPKTLMKVEVPLVSPKRCEAAYPNQITKTMLCAGYIQGQKDSCQGDSGGPLYVRLLSGQHQLAGVVSWGQGCARPNKFGVYADVHIGLEWIQSEMLKN